MATKNEARVQKFFKENLTVKEVSQTSDGFIFLKTQDAKAHSKKLKNQTVVPFKRSTETVKTETTTPKRAVELKAVIETVKLEKVKELTKEDTVKKVEETKAVTEPVKAEKVKEVVKETTPKKVDEPITVKD